MAYHYGREDDGCDNRGTKIEVGQAVAYNLSGEVMVGEVIRIAEGSKYSKPHTYYHVKATIEGNHSYGNKGRESKMNYSKNLLVLREG